MQFKSKDCKLFGHRLTPDGGPQENRSDNTDGSTAKHGKPVVFQWNGKLPKRFSPVLSELSEPLGRLCKSGVEWAWEFEQQNAFEAIKQVIMALPVLTYFNKTKKHTIQCDAFKKGLGAVLLQGVQACHACVKSIN